jgi:methionyl aminopeptidase
VSIKSESDLSGLRAAGRVVRHVIDAMRAALRPGITTGELDEIAGRVLREHDARSAPKLVYGFPGEACISVNEEAVHGIPGGRVIEEGDLVKLDVTVEKDGYMADAAITVAVPPIDDQRLHLIRTARSAFYRGMAAARAGRRVRDIGWAVEKHVRGEGFSVIRELGGHGIGRSIHEEPSVPNFPAPDNGVRLTDGLVITIEPIIAAMSGRVVEEPDGWTIRTRDRSPVAHFEQTIVITRGMPIVLTA